MEERKEKQDLLFPLLFHLIDISCSRRFGAVTKSKESSLFVVHSVFLLLQYIPIVYLLYTHSHIYILYITYIHQIGLYPTNTLCIDSSPLNLFFLCICTHSSLSLSLSLFTILLNLDLLKTLCFSLYIKKLFSIVIIMYTLNQKMII